jgi:hypothetical protein
LSHLPFSLCLASAQTAPAGRFPEPLEKFEMPPAPAGLYRLESSPRMISPYAGFVSYQVNVDANGNNIVGDAANEPSIAVDPTNGNKITIGWRQFKPGHLTSAKAAMVTARTPVSRGISQAFCKTRFPQRPGAGLR